jgi:hypothetical protein
VSGTTQATVAVATPAFAKRKARALIGWLTEEEGALWLAGRNQQAASDAILIQRCRAARTAASTRAAHTERSDTVSPLPDSLASYVAKLRSNPWGAKTIADAGEPALVDLRYIRAMQPVVHIEDAKKRVAADDPKDLVAIAALSIPIPPTDPPDLQAVFDPSKQAHMMSSPNPNLRVLGQVATMGEMGPGLRVHVFGFAVMLSTSCLNVGGVAGHYFLRDGYHRAIGFLQSGITHVPALVRQYANIQEASMPAGMLSPDVVLGDHPALLPDYCNDSVSAETMSPLGSKMVVIQALELTPLG